MERLQCMTRWDTIVAVDAERYLPVARLIAGLTYPACTLDDYKLLRMYYVHRTGIRPFVWSITTTRGQRQRIQTDSLDIEDVGRLIYALVYLTHPPEGDVPGIQDVRRAGSIYNCLMQVKYHSTHKSLHTATTMQYLETQLLQTASQVVGVHPDTPPRLAYTLLQHACKQDEAPAHIITQCMAECRGRVLFDEFMASVPLDYERLRCAVCAASSPFYTKISDSVPHALAVTSKHQCVEPHHGDITAQQWFATDFLVTCPIFTWQPINQYDKAENLRKALHEDPQQI
jgi:hypothetical protein